jgi:hypothetical protein
MAKLKLRLEALSVESFAAVEAAPPVRGTVRGAATAPADGCPNYTDWYSCNGAGYTCHVSCLPPTTTEG